MRRHLLWLTAACAFAALAQHKLSFEVASVKVNTAGRGAKRGPADPGLFTFHNATLKMLILRAYGIADYELSGGPGWMENDRFDVDARPEHAASQADMLLMLRTLLADRFQLATHHQSKTMPLYVLSVAKGGPKFGKLFQLVKDGPVSYEGTSSQLALGGTLKDFASLLRRNMQMFNPATGPVVPAADVPPIVDQTGLAGQYSIFVPTDTHEDWSETLEHQLGLKLELKKVPLDILVIDRAVKPSEN